MQLVAEGKLGKGGVILRKPIGAANITKIKIGAEEAIFIVYELPPNTSEVRVVKFACKEVPRKEFYEALEQIFKTVINCGGLDAKVWESGKVSEVSLKQTDEGLDAVIVLHLGTEEGAFELKMIQRDVSHDLSIEIDNLLAEAEDYMRGIRAQTSLFEQAESAVFSQGETAKPMGSTPQSPQQGEPPQGAALQDEQLSKRAESAATTLPNLF